MKHALRLLCILLLLLPLCLVSCDEPADTTTEGFSEYYRHFYYRPTKNAGNLDQIYGYVRDGVAHYERPPVRDGYVLLGLFDDEDKLVFDADGRYVGFYSRADVLTCHWIRPTVTIELAAYSPENELIYTRTLSLSYGSAVPSLPVPTAVGYEGFEGWRLDGRHEIITDENGAPCAGFDTLTVANYKVLWGQEEGHLRMAATLEPTKHTVTFDYNDGSGRRSTVTVPYGTDIADITAPTHCSGVQDICGWSLSKTATVSPTETVTEDITLYAVWAPCRTVTLHYGYGAADVTVHLAEGEALTLPPDTEDYYTFDGWYTSADMSGSPVSGVGGIPMAEAALDYYRHLSPISYTVSFVTGGGTACESITYTADEKTVLPTPTRDNYRFLGWNDGNGSAPMMTLEGVGGITTLYAVWEGEERILSYNGGSTPLAESVTYGEAFCIDTIAAPEGFLFRGWADADGNPLTDKSGASLDVCRLTEQVTEIFPILVPSYRMTIVNDRTDLGAISGGFHHELAEGESYTLTLTWKPTRDTGYEFIGYYAGDVLLSRATTYTHTMSAQDVTITAKYAPKTYEIKLDLTGVLYCNTDGTADVTYTANYTLPVPYKQGYAFLGWADEIGNMMTDADGKSLIPWKHPFATTLVPRFEASANSVFPIYDAATLLVMKDYPAIRYVLQNDIDMAGITWTPFAFSGTLDGNGYSIKNLTVVSEGARVGMFTGVSGTVSNLTLVNLSVTGKAYEAAQIGGLCGHLSATGCLSRVTVASGSVTGNCYATTGNALYGQIHDVTSALGGIVGFSEGKLYECTSYANVTSATYPEGFAVGGIAGFLRSGWLEGVVNYGDVQSRTKYTGGIAGVCWYETALRGVTNYGDVEGTTLVGGVFGLLKHMFGENYQVANLVNHGDVEGISTVGGVIGEMSLYWDERYSITIYANGLENTGAVKASASSGVAAAGGIIGKVYSRCGYIGDYYITLKLTDLTNTGAVASSGATGVGGLVGWYDAIQGWYELLGCTQNGTVSASGTTLDVGTYVGKSGN